MKNKSLVFLFILTAFNFLILQSNILAQQNDGKEFQDWLKQKQEKIAKDRQEFENFVTKRDQEFNGFLKKRWEEFEAYSGIKLYKEPKPDKLPVVDDAVDSQPKKNLVIETPDLTPQDIIDIVPSASPKFEAKELSLGFFGQKIVLNVPATIYELDLRNELKEQVYADNWIKMSSGIDPEFIKDLQKIKSELKLNDWGYAILIQDVVKSIYTDQRSTMLSWFLLNKSGLKTRIGHSNNKEVFIMIAPSVTIYSMPYYILGEKKDKFFPVSDFKDPYKTKVKKIKTYGAEYPGKQSTYNLSFTSAPTFGNSKPFNRKVEFPFQDKNYKFSVGLNQNILDYMKTVPLSEFDVYYSSTISQAAFETAISKLYEFSKEMDEVTKLNFLLRFTQKFTEYKTDEEQFGREYYMFPDQVMYFSYSDCDDRVSLFSYLVRRLTRNQIIYLRYPDHIATAVSLKKKTTGDTVKHKGKAFYVADPTYIGADLGMTMPMYKEVEPEIIVIN